MDNRTKKEIEWHFKNYEADRAFGAEEVADTAERGLTASYGSGITSGQISRPTENAGIRLKEHSDCYYWARVVENVRTAFAPEIQGEIIEAKFFADRKHSLSFKQMVEKFGNGNESVYKYRYDKILDLAAWWAQRYGLIRIRGTIEFKRSVPDN